ncbi:hypothetical protein ACHQM5_007910 [Ranunculus cassubicifolius]
MVKTYNNFAAKVLIKSIDKAPGDKNQKMLKRHGKAECCKQRVYDQYTPWTSSAELTSGTAPTEIVSSYGFALQCDLHWYASIATSKQDQIIPNPFQIDVVCIGLHMVERNQRVNRMMV